ncbi:2,3-bisphosphoglycerate-independent phosphoglycerate mutase [Infirmifilum lucidum]|uniref:2,3-bisphosphoglycerate-independent phosphoglycerate mutase n=1 Tax=Infirmifilum lucidum TaxID=2776706 RepID=A0A7L9FKL7_9CREN|nr:alkaline phosphatase family protein [Infirmifilum lucidum]QOJ79355.1 2,3-bisphosphoglycerate-independent phosphoglycerate mutase [Infirmifilum lucidum]
MKLVYLVLDGVADRPGDGPTSLELSSHPALDELAKRSKAGLMYTIGKGVAPESDAAVISILGYNPHEEYTGRGPLEAVGAGLSIREGYEVAFRANFATIDPDTRRIVDRRCGRNLTSEEARELARALDGAELGVYNAYARVVATVGHRAVVVIGSRDFRLSDAVENTDPAYSKQGYVSVAKPTFEPFVARARPLEDTEEARRTAELVNAFTELSISVLRDHSVNVKRSKEGKLPANAILLRDSGGRLPRLQPISEKFGLSFGAVAEMPVEIGIARVLKMDVEAVPPPTGDKKSDYRVRLEATKKLLEKSDAVYVHLKGPDEPGHDGDLKAKVESVEAIDAYYVSPLLDLIEGEDIAVIVTADHATPYTRKSHTDDPVPLILYSPNLHHDGVERFTEKECSKGSLGVFQHGWEMLPKILEVLRGGR